MKKFSGCKPLQKTKLSLMKFCTEVLGVPFEGHYTIFFIL